MVKFNNL